MARRLKVFAVSFLLACLFCFSASAEFSATDSSNLSFIRSDVSTIRTYISNLSQLGLIESWLESISNNFISYFDPSRYGSFSQQNLSKLDTLISRGSSVSSQLDQIISALGSDSKGFNTDDAIYCFDSFHYDGTTNESYPGMIANNIGNLVVFNNTNGRYLNTFLPAGEYILLINLSTGMGSDGVNFESNAAAEEPSNRLQIPGSQIPFIGIYNGIQRFRVTFTIPEGGMFFGDFWVALSGPGYAACYVYQIDGQEGVVADALTPSIDSHGHDLDQGVNQMEDLENTAFESLDTSIGSLDFSGSALGQVVSGFTFIRAVFSAVYGSSPYISVLINLSCMLGVLALFLRVQPRFSRWEREHRDKSS